MNSEGNKEDCTEILQVCCLGTISIGFNAFFMPFVVLEILKRE